MADEADKADAYAFEMLTRAIAYASTRPPHLAPIGECYNCRASVAEGMRFCDKDCMDDWEKRNQRG